AIGTEITLESKKAIEGARAAYEKLSEAQKKLVSNLEVLTKAEEELKKLEGQQGQQEEKPIIVTLVNKKYGVSLKGEGLTEDMELKVEPLNKDSKDVERMRKEITSKKSIFRLFNIKLMKDGKEIQLPKNAILSIPVGEKYNGKELVVLACNDKEIKHLNGKVTDGMVSVEVAELMNFGVVVDAVNSEKDAIVGSGSGNAGGSSSGNKGVKTGDQTPTEALVLLALLSGVAMMLTVGKRRREQN
ncbi:MAG: cell surface protein, partial [Lachnospiraceae bacterium]|nr:cell surface protein [Lachnospiraceae bacterium]